MIWTLIIGAIIGSIAGAIVGRQKKSGCFFNIAAGLIGSWIGSRLLGDWGPHLADMALIPSIIGAVIFVAVVSAIFSNRQH